jgi:hypothetical protein
MGLKIKIILTAIIFIIVGIILKLEPVVNTQLAVNQASDTIDSTYAFTAYQGIREYLWLVYVVVPVLMFWKEIRKMFKDEKGE